MNLIFAFLIFLIFTALRLSWRIRATPFDSEIENRLNKQLPVVFAHLHQEEWAHLGNWAHRGMHVLVSLSKDGSLMAHFLSLLGYKIARGSSSRNAAGGLLQYIRFVKASTSHKTMSLAFDGPRGPYGRAKKGVLLLAKSFESPIVVAGAAASRKWVFSKSWSKAFIPKPFSRVEIAFLKIPWEEVSGYLSQKNDGETLLLQKIEKLAQDAKLLAEKNLELPLH